MLKSDEILTSSEGTYHNTVLKFVLENNETVGKHNIYVCA